MNDLVFNCPSLELNLNNLIPEDLISNRYQQKKDSQIIAIILPSKKYLENAM